jgi:LmbE family N-acetylglucosaminyl deacetylase
MKNFKKILVVAAHPDDETLGCGATIAKEISDGAEVCFLILGEGLNARGKHSENEFGKLENNAKKAIEILGAKKLVMKKFPDNSFDSVPLLDIIKEVEKTIDEFQPDAVFTHSNTDRNVDHKLTCEAVKTACRPMKGSSVKVLLSFEVPSSTEWGLDKRSVFSPNYFVDVSETIGKKLEAMSAYEDELREFPHPRSLEYIEALAKVRGGQSGYNAAEAFELIYQK